MRKRLVAAFLSIILLMLLVQDIPLIQYLDRVEHNQITTSLERDAWRIASYTEQWVQERDLAPLRATANSYSLQTGARVVITDETGLAIVTSDGEDLNTTFINRPEIYDALQGRATSGERYSISAGDSLLYVAVPIERGNDLVGALRITFPQQELHNIIRSRIGGIVIVGVLTLLIASLFALWIARAITERIRRLQAATAELAAGNLDLRLSTEGRGGAPELRQLESAFDRMTERLSSVLGSQRSFASDASHQLRTPLTALRLRLENAAADVTDPVATAAAIEAASVEVVRMQVLIDGLLALARLEGSAPQLVPVNVSDIVAEHIEMWRPLADERQLRLRLELAPAATVLATEWSVAQILDAYLDNAIDFAPAGSTIEVVVSTLEDRVELHVIDSGQGMTEEQRSRAFDRFFTARPDGGGNGLGLAIVTRIAEMLGGQVRLDPAATGGVDAVLSLPEYRD